FIRTEVLGVVVNEEMFLQLLHKAVNVLCGHLFGSAKFRGNLRANLPEGMASRQLGPDAQGNRVQLKSGTACNLHDGLAVGSCGYPRYAGYLHVRLFLSFPFSSDSFSSDSFSSGGVL